jgi:subtilisin family serine protease
VGSEQTPCASPQELVAAIFQCIDAGARVINLSLALAEPSAKREPFLEEALNQAARRSVIVVAAAGNQGTLGSSAITRHPWVIPVIACEKGAAEEVFDRILRMTDNAGATDEHRALNYLAMRYPGIYAKAAEEFARDFSLGAVEVRPSQLGGTRNIVDVIFSFTNRYHAIEG